MSESLRFFAAELDVYRPGSGSAMVGHVLGEAPIGDVPADGGVVEDSTTLLASDVGYVTPLDNPGGVRVYVPTLAQAIAVDRSISLAIGGAGAAGAWGGVRLDSGGAGGGGNTGDRDGESRPVGGLLGREARPQNPGPGA